MVPIVVMVAMKIYNGTDVLNALFSIPKQQVSDLLKLLIHFNKNRRLLMFINFKLGHFASNENLFLCLM